MVFLPFFTTTERVVVSRAVPEQCATLQASNTLVFRPRTFNFLEETTILGRPACGLGRGDVAGGVVVVPVGVVVVFVVVVVVVPGEAGAATPSLKIVPKRSDIAGLVVAVTVT